MAECKMVGESSRDGDKVKSIVNACFVKFKENNGMYVGYIEGSAMYEKFLNDLSVSGYSFVIRTSCSPSAESHKDTFYFQLVGKNEHSTAVIPFCGSPFQLEKSIRLHCAHGGNYHKKKETAIPVELENHPKPKKKYKKKHVPKKLGCPATMTVKCIRLYPDFVIKAECNWRQRKKVLQNLKKMRKESGVKSILRYYISISSTPQHTHNEVCTMLGGRLNPKLGNEVKKLVRKNITSTKYIKYHLKHFVDEMFQCKDEKPKEMNTIFYPSEKIIGNHVAYARFKMRIAEMNREPLGKAIDMWKNEAPGDNFFFRPPADPADSTSSLTFCHQTKWQQRLLSRYGNHMCLLDATYKTTKYSFPLFLLYVKTNVGYCVVATFVIENETREAIQEALQIIRSWNPEWQPQNFMTDFSENEIEALEAVFHGSKVYICSFYLDQCWVRWLNNQKNVNEADAANFMELWQAIAHACTEEEYNTKLEDLKKSSCWKNYESARKYFTSHWIPCYKRWVDAFYSRGLYLSVRTNNGLEAQYSVLENSYLQDHPDKTLTGVLTAIVEDFLPDQYRKYCKDNTKVDAGYREEIPSYLHERPYQFVKHVMERLEKAETDYSAAKVRSLSDGLFLVQSEDNEDNWFFITFDPVCCSCEDFTKWMFPCKHLCAIFTYVPSWSFEKLSPQYTQSVFLTIDTEHDYATSVSTHHIANVKVDNNKDWEEYETLISFSQQMASQGTTTRTTEDDTSMDKLQEKLREELKMQLYLTYMCQDKTVLQSVIADAEAARNKLQEGVSIDGSVAPKVPNCTVTSKQTRSALPKKRKCSKVKDADGNKQARLLQEIWTESFNLQ